MRGFLRERRTSTDPASSGSLFGNACRDLFLLVVLAAFLAAIPAVAHAAPIPGQYVVVLRDEADAADAEGQAERLGAEVFARYRHALSGYAARMSDSTLAEVKSDPRVEFVSPDYEVSAQGQTLPTGIDRIDGELSSARSGDGGGAVDVDVAVLDTGIDLKHPDLNVAGGQNCASGKSFDDGNGHGTLVAGTLGAKDNDFGVVGVAPGARLWAVAVLDNKGSGARSQIICGIDWVTSTRTDQDPANDIVVANMSLGGSGTDDGNCGRTNGDAEHLAICNSVDAGVTYVTVAGNRASDFSTFVPAAYDEVLTATAMEDWDGQPGGLDPSFPDDCIFPAFKGTLPDDRFAAFSSFATLAADEAHTLAAPGNCILTTATGGKSNGAVPAPSGDYEYASGTSMAAPHLAGTAVLCIVSGACRGQPARVISTLVNDARQYNRSNPSYGFGGDPLRPVAGKYYGFLTRAAGY